MKNPLQPIVNYFLSAKAELEKVSWPSKQDTLRYGTVVIVVGAIAAGVFTSIDFGLNKTITALLASRAGTASQAPAPTAPIVPEITTEPVSAQGTDKNGKPVDVQITPTNSDGTIKIEAPTITTTPAPTPTPAPAPVK